MNKVATLILCFASFLLSGCISDYTFDPRIKAEDRIDLEKFNPSKLMGAQAQLIVNEVKILRKALQRVGLNEVSVEVILKDIFLVYWAGYSEANADDKEDLKRFQEELELQYKIDRNTDFIKQRYRSKTYCLLQPSIVSQLARNAEKINLFAERNIFLHDREVFKYLDINEDHENPEKTTVSLKVGAPLSVLGANAIFEDRYGETYENYVLNIEARYKEAVPEIFSVCNTSFKEQYDSQKVQFLEISDLFE